MTSTIAMSLNKNTPFLPTLTDAAYRPSALVARTPTPSPNLLLRRRLQRYGANGPPTLKKRKRHNDDASFSQSTFLPINTNLPLLDFTDDDNDDERRRQADVFPPLPSTALKKRSSRKNNFLFSSPQDFYLQQEVQVQVQPRLQQQQAKVEETQDLQEPAPRRRRTNTSSSAPVASVTPSTPTTTNTTIDNVMSMTRSISLQFSLSLMNLASANGSNSSCSQLLLPTKRQSLQIPKALSTMSLEVNGSNHSCSGNEMTMLGQRSRSPVTTTLDYLAKSMRFPDVAIGLSI